MQKNRKFYISQLRRVVGEPGAYPIGHKAGYTLDRVPVHPSVAVNPVNPESIHTPMGNFALPVCVPACFWIAGGKRRSRTRGEHEKLSTDMKLCQHAIKNNNNNNNNNSNNNNNNLNPSENLCTS